MIPQGATPVIHDRQIFLDVNTLLNLSGKQSMIVVPRGQEDDRRNLDRCPNFIVCLIQRSAEYVDLEFFHGRGNLCPFKVGDQERAHT